MRPHCIKRSRSGGDDLAVTATDTELPPDASGPPDADLNPEYRRFCQVLEAPISDTTFQAGLQCKQNTDDWLNNWRKLKAYGGQVVVGTFGGSNVANHFGVGYRAKPNSAYVASLEMVHGSSFKPSPPTEWGHGGEPFARVAFMEYLLSLVGTGTAPIEVETGDSLVDVHIESPGVIIHRKCPWRRFSPDGVLVWTMRRRSESVDENTYQIRDLVEIKCPYTLRNRCDGFSREDGYPVEQAAKSNHLAPMPIKSYYMPQLQWGMDIGKRENVLTRKRAHFLTWWPGYWDPHVIREATKAEMYDNMRLMRGDDAAVAPPPPFNKSIMEELRNKHYYNWPYHEEAVTAGGVSKNVIGRSGSFQWTEVTFDAEYTTQLISATERSWREHVLPELWAKLRQQQDETRADRDWVLDAFFS